MVKAVYARGGRLRSENNELHCRSPGAGVWLGATLMFVVSTMTAVIGCAPSNRPDVVYQRARQALDAGDYETVQIESERLINAKGHESEGRLLMGLMLARKNKPMEALGQLQQAVSDETIVEAATAAAKCLYQMGHFPEAINAALMALSKDAAALDARRWLAATYYDLGAMSQAIAELEQISREAPKDSRPDRLLGLIAKDGEHYAEAIDHYRESLRREPSQPEREVVLEELAESQFKLDQFEQAISTLQSCQRSASTLTMEADCRHALGQIDTAQELLRKAVELDPRYFPAKLSQGNMFLDAGQADRATEVLEDAVRLEPANSQAHFQFSQALRVMGDSERAADEMQKMQNLKALEREFSDLHETAAQQSADAEVRCQLGDLARKLEKPGLARMWYRAALAINPNHDRARQGIAAIPNNTSTRSTAH